jgi:septal ring factor EnvC (AmiA/AmiB activator)
VQGWRHARQLAAALLLALPLAAGAQAARPTRAQAAKNQASAQKELAGTRAQIKALSAEQKQLEGQRDAAAGELREIDEVVARAQRDLHDTQNAIAAQESALLALQARRAELEQALSQQRAELATLVRSAYAIGRQQELQMLLEQQRMGDLARVLAYHHYFEKARTERIGKVNAELQELAQVATQIEARKQELLAAQSRQSDESRRLAAQKRERSQLVAKLDARYKDRSTRLGALGRDEKNTVALLAKLRKLMASLPPPAPPKPKPVPGTPSKPGAPRPSAPVNAAAALGTTNLPLQGSLLAGYRGTMPDGHQSQGLLIAGNAGAQVHAVRAGRIAYADWLKGYGLLVIVDHGGGWMTLYAFNDALLKNAGDEVQSGEAIATVGSSGGQGRPALYFELRKDGQPANPATWLKK